MWSKEYADLTRRNIGILTEKQQQLLKDSCIVVFGLGGLGGVIAEIFVRSGVGCLVIVDSDKFEPTNSNRQIFSFRDTAGRLKTDVTDEFLKRINPEIKIRKFTEVTPQNINQILEGADIAVLAIDSVKPCVIISRSARDRGILLVEGWAIPFGNVRVFTKDSPTLEEVYGLPTMGKEISAISDEEFKTLKIYALSTLKKIEGVEAFYPPLAVERIMQGLIPSFAPLVWLTAALMSLEALKIILNWGKLSFSPDFALYNPFNNSIPKQEG